jgi:chromosomal replication initiation ATPase DnaA
MKLNIKPLYEKYKIFTNEELYIGAKQYIIKNWIDNHYRKEILRMLEENYMNTNLDQRNEMIVFIFMYDIKLDKF